MADARTAYDAATLAVKKCPTKDHGGGKAEVAFGVAYQRLVKEQGAAQLRKRKRP